MDRIETSQPNGRGQQGGAIEQLGAEQDLVQAGELATRLFKSRRAAGEDGSYHLNSGKGARHGRRPD
jgi:hypothetical protein